MPRISPENQAGYLIGSINFVHVELRNGEWRGSATLPVVA